MRRTFRLSLTTNAALGRMRTMLQVDRDGRRVTWSEAINHAARLAEDHLRARLIGRGIDPDAVLPRPERTPSSWLGAEDYMVPEVD